MFTYEGSAEGCVSNDYDERQVSGWRRRRYLM
jgi:hypothetical protein